MKKKYTNKELGESYIFPSEISKNEIAKEVSEFIKSSKNIAWLVIWNTKDNSYMLLSTRIYKNMKEDYDIVIEKISSKLSDEEVKERYNIIIGLHQKLSPMVICKNTNVRDKMTIKEKKIADEVSDNWIRWIKENCKVL